MRDYFGNNRSFVDLIPSNLRNQTNTAVLENLFDRFDEIRQYVVGFRAIDQMRVVVRGDKNHGYCPIMEDSLGSLDAIHLGHLNVGNDKIRPQLVTMFYQLTTVLSDRYHLVAQSRKDLLEVLLHIRLIVSHSNPQHGKYPFILAGNDTVVLVREGGKNTRSILPD